MLIECPEKYSSNYPYNITPAWAEWMEKRVIELEQSIVYSAGGLSLLTTTEEDIHSAIIKMNTIANY